MLSQSNGRVSTGDVSVSTLCLLPEGDKQFPLQAILSSGYRCHVFLGGQLFSK